MNILWLSNAPWARTGYGGQTRLFWHRIQALGHTVTLQSNWGLRGAPLNITDGDQATKVLPLGFDRYGGDIVSSHAKACGADIVITLYDAWVFDPRNMAKVKWCPWAPVDHDPLPDRIKLVLEMSWQPIAYSKFGERKMKEAGLNPRYVPHGIDTDEFAPQDRKQARAALGIEDDIEFVALMVTANKGKPSRKSIAECLWAWRTFLTRHPKSLLYMHTHIGPEMGGIAIKILLTKLGIEPGRVMLADPYQNTVGYSNAFMANAYSAADVLLNPSRGEGFGLPIVEAQACGCPVIVNNWTSMPELCFSGWIVEGQPEYTPMQSWQSTPDIEDIEDKLELAWEARGDQSIRDKARDCAMAYNVDRVTETYWKPVLEELEDELKSGDGVLENLVDLT